MTGKLGRRASELLCSFQRNLKKVERSTGRKEIHHLRLDLKELFALLNALNLCVDNFSKEFKHAVKFIRLIFKLTGDIRDNQLIEKQAKYLLPFKVYKSVKKNTTENIEIAKQKLDEVLLGVDLEEIKVDLLMGFKEVSHIRAKMIVLNFKHRINRDEEKIKKAFASKKVNYHLIRRLVKEQYFLLLTLKTHFKEKVKQDRIIRDHYWGKVLGDWHDLQVLLGMVLKWEINISEECIKLIGAKEAQLIKQVKKVGIP